MFYEPPKIKKASYIDVNEELLKLTGELEDMQAKITLAQFLYKNIGFTTKLISGIELYPDQIVSIKGFIQNNYSLCVWSRGLGKTTLAAIYCFLQMIFRPNTNILIAGPTFRTARFIFNHIEKIMAQPEATILANALGDKKTKRNDEFRWTINGGELMAIPLNSEKIRGYRCQVLLVDEFLLMPQEIVEKVLTPYLVAVQDQGRRQQIRRKENELIKKGLMEEKDRILFKNDAKMIAFSSASFTCEYLYKKFEEYTNAIYSPDLTDNGATYFVSQMAWNSVANYEDRMDKSIIELGQSNLANTTNFQREYGGQFVDGSDSYFSMNKMIECTIPDGESDTLLLKGRKDRKYILGIDPNLSNSTTSDHFAMCLLELSEDGTSGTVVHQYAMAGVSMEKHVQYFHYLLTYFNIVMIAIDSMGCQFIETCAASNLFINSRLEPKIFDYTAGKEGQDVIEETKKARREYNLSTGKIIFTQVFNSNQFVRQGNEHLQYCINYKKIWFAASIKANGNEFNKAVNTRLPEGLVDMKDLDQESEMGYFVDLQETLIRQVKYQTSSIEVKVGVKGTVSFDLPAIFKKNSSSDRLRKDSYTALMLAAWVMKHYQLIMGSPVEEAQATFVPFMLD